MKPRAATYDRSGLFANHSVQVVVSWKALELAGAIEEKGIKAVLRESRQIVGAINGLASISELFDLRYLLGIINSRFIRQYVASNKLEGTREGRIYPDVWKRLPIKVASAERQQQIAIRVDSIQARYEQLAAVPTPASLAADPTIAYRDPQGYLALGVLRFFGDTQSTIAERPTLQDSLSAEIEALIETTYKEPADAHLMEVISTKMVHGNNSSLF